MNKLLIALALAPAAALVAPSVPRAPATVVQSNPGIGTGQGPSLEWGGSDTTTGGAKKTERGPRGGRHRAQAGRRGGRAPREVAGAGARGEAPQGRLHEGDARRHAGRFGERLHVQGGCEGPTRQVGL